MKTDIFAQLTYAVPDPCPLLIQIEVAETSNQSLIASKLDFGKDTYAARVDAEDGVGHRIWLDAQEVFECSYSATVSLSRRQRPLERVAQVPLSALPGPVIKYLMPSRYCHPAAFYEFTETTFGTASGGDLIAQMLAWTLSELTYSPGASTAFTTAKDTFDARAGVCRDYAHVMVTLARAVSIPARVVSAYAPDVAPQDFHMAVQVYLDGGWYLLDPTGMAQPEEIIMIGVGRDAADVPFLSSFGAIELKQQSVEVIRR